MSLMKNMTSYNSEYDSQVLKVSNKIRDSLHNSTILKTNIFQKRAQGFWDQLWTCLDTVNHTEIAILEFESLEKDVFLKAPNNLTFGLLQNLYVQQDSLNNLSESILGKPIKVWTDKYPSFSLIRNIRNITIGHPTKKEGKKSQVREYCVIDQNSLTKDGFSFWVWSSAGFNQQHVRFSELIEKQREELITELKKILKHIENQELEHKKTFKAQSLSKLLPSGEPYSLSVLNKLAYDQLGWIMFQDYKHKYVEIKSGLEKRYGELNQTLRIPGTKLLIDELDRIFQRIEELKYGGSDMEIDLNIYSDALVDRLKELKTHLDEIDEEFKTKKLSARG